MDDTSPEREGTRLQVAHGPCLLEHSVSVREEGVKTCLRSFQYDPIFHLQRPLTISLTTDAP